MRKHIDFMKNGLWVILIFTANIIVAQNLTFSVETYYDSPFGNDENWVGITPIFELNSDSIHNKSQSAAIKHLPSNIDKTKIAYGFLYFAGIEESTFPNEMVILIMNYSNNNPVIYVDRNGNLDFTDDGVPMKLENNFILQLENHNDKSAIFNYRLLKSKIKNENVERITSYYAAKYQNSIILPTSYWIANQRLTVRISKGKINKKPITILLYDGSVDGRFTYQADDVGDRILIIEGVIEKGINVNEFIRQGEPIDTNATFLLYGNKYSLKSINENGNSLTIEATEKNISTIYKVGDDISSLKIVLLSGKSLKIKDILSPKKYLLIDIGGTWCGGCIAQEPLIKELYKSGKINVVGLFGYDTNKSVITYTKKHNIKWPVALMSKGFQNLFRISSYPTYILLSPEGKVVVIHLDSNKIESYLSKHKI